MQPIFNILKWNTPTTENTKKLNFDAEINFLQLYNRKQPISFRFFRLPKNSFQGYGILDRPTKCLPVSSPDDHFWSYLHQKAYNRGILETEKPFSVRHSTNPKTQTGFFGSGTSLTVANFDSMSNFWSSQIGKKCWNQCPWRNKIIWDKWTIALVSTKSNVIKMPIHYFGFNRFR